jgi:FtsP/CotA-like multicopper oxidase with cupredoxin domain
LINHAPTPVTFHLHGHPMRWLDRLDDGWKPFWLDTVLLQGGQTIRTAFLAEHSGAWLMEAMGTDWSSPRLARWYVVN